MNRSALSPSNLWSMIKETVGAWVDDFAPSMGASIAYYTVFSIAPLLIIVIAFPLTKLLESFLSALLLEHLEAAREEVINAHLGDPRILRLRAIGFGFTLAIFAALGDLSVLSSLALLLFLELLPLLDFGNGFSLFENAFKVLFLKFLGRF